MEDIELKNMWKEYEKKIDEARILNLQSWVVNLKTFEHLQSQKAKSKLNALSSQKKWTILLGIAWVIFLIFLVYNSLEISKIFFVISLSAIALFNIYSIIIYIKHIILIKEIDNSESLVETQKKLAALQASTLNIPRILFLQTPFYSTFFWSSEWITSAPVSFWLITFPITLFFVWASVWLYLNISYKNANKKWFKILFSGNEWTSVVKATEYLKEIDEFKKEMA
jgi:hypothetical protein